MADDQVALLNALADCARAVANGMAQIAAAMSKLSGELADMHIPPAPRSSAPRRLLAHNRNRESGRDDWSCTDCPWVMGIASANAAKAAFDEHSCARFRETQSSAGRTLLTHASETVGVNPNWDCSDCYWGLRAVSPGQARSEFDEHSCEQFS